MAYTTIDNPELYFQAKLWTGNDGTQSITLDGSENMAPDFVWIKARNSAINHSLFDSVRGATKELNSNANTAEETETDMLTAFGTDGFTLGSAGGVNNSSRNYTSWNWKMGTSFSNDASATGVGSIDSSGSINTIAGQSIISWTGSGSGATIAHGIAIQPQIVFVKNRSDTASWSVYTVDGGGGKGLFLNEGNGYDSDSSYFNNGTASVTTFPVGTANIANGSSDNMIAYCFGNVKGYSKIGAYVGNGSTNGVYVHCGFKPSFLLTKCTSASRNWQIRDNKINSFNVTESFLEANGTVAEQTDSGFSSVDLLSNGFKSRGVGGDTNVSGADYIFMAFAESPFVNSNGVPNNAE